MNIKNFLLSANSGEGFHNNFKYCINPNLDSFTYILKGGPGTGKSTLMKKVGEYFATIGEDVELFYCSSDVNSLDGVLIKSKNVAIVDGTSPHITEASMPQIKEKIINLGQHIKPEVAKNKQDIEDLLRKKSDLYKDMYLIVNAISKLIEVEVNNQDIGAISQEEFKRVLSILPKNLKSKDANKDSRHLFSKYLGVDGLNDLNNNNSFNKNIFLFGNYKENDKTLHKIEEYLNFKKIDVVILHNNFIPTYYDSIYIPECNCIIKSPFNISNQQINSAYENLINYCGDILNQILNYHKKVEEYYVANIDFIGLDDECDKIISEIKLKE